jgi:hypothetical protein
MPETRLTTFLAAAARDGFHMPRNKKGNFQIISFSLCFFGHSIDHIRSSNFNALQIYWSRNWNVKSKSPDGSHFSTHVCFIRFSLSFEIWSTNLEFAQKLPGYRERQCATKNRARTKFLRKI